jgi:Cu/Ag efflux protein CusF
MKRFALVTMLCLFCCATLALAQTVTRGVAAKEGEGAAVGQLVEVNAIVQEIDQEAREVTLKSAEGEVFSMVVGEEAHNLYQVGVGDKVLIQYYEQLTLLLEKVEDGMPSISEKVTGDRAKKGETPGGMQTREVTLTTKVVAIDTEASTVTLTGPKGRSVTLEVEPQRLEHVKVGDLVSAVYSEALAISVELMDKVKAE